MSQTTRVSDTTYRDGSLSSMSSSNSDGEVHNLWSPLLELFYHTQIGQGMETMVDEISTARVALSCHFALDILCDKVQCEIWDCSLFQTQLPLVTRRFMSRACVTWGTSNSAAHPVSLCELKKCYSHRIT